MPEKASESRFFGPSVATSFAAMLVLLVAAHAAAVPRTRHALAALEADIDALERMQTNPMYRNTDEDCDPGAAWAPSFWVPSCLWGVAACSDRRPFRRRCSCCRCAGEEANLYATALLGERWSRTAA